MNICRLDDDITVLADYLEVPGIGFLPVNAFVLGGSQPVVVDTGLSLPNRDFLASLRTVLDPASVHWIWLTHPDRDHTGGLFELLEAAPLARVVTTYLGVGILSTERPLPLDRVFLLNPGQTLDVGERQLRALRPPLFDNPATVGFVDDRSGAFFCSDCFGAPMASPALALADDVRAVAPDALRGAQLLWATVDSPWVQVVDRSQFGETLRALGELDPPAILSSHLPPAMGQTSAFLDMLQEAPLAPPFVGPDQEALQKMLAGLAPAAARVESAPRQ